MNGNEAREDDGDEQQQNDEQDSVRVSAILRIIFDLFLIKQFLKSLVYRAASE